VTHLKSTEHATSLALSLPSPLPTGGSPPLLSCLEIPIKSNTSNTSPFAAQLDPQHTEHVASHRTHPQAERQLCEREYKKEETFTFEISV